MRMALSPAEKQRRYRQRKKHLGEDAFLVSGLSAEDAGSDQKKPATPRRPPSAPPGDGGGSAATPETVDRYADGFTAGLLEGWDLGIAFRMFQEIAAGERQSEFALAQWLRSKGGVHPRFYACLASVGLGPAFSAWARDWLSDSMRA